MSNWTPESFLVVSVLFAAIPLLVATGSCYLKFSIVLGLLRSGFGTQSAPSSALVMALSLVMSLTVMQPVVTETIEKLQTVRAADLGKLTLAQLVVKGAEVAEPWRAFLLKHAGDRELIVLASCGEARRDPSAASRDQSQPFDRSEVTLGLAASAFVLTEIKSAFLTGFLLLIPFFVIDLIVSNLLVGLGLTMMSPTIVSLPIKIFLFVSSDGWLLLAKNLMAGY